MTKAADAVRVDRPTAARRSDELPFNLPGHAERALGFAIDVVLTLAHVLTWMVVLSPFDIGADPVAGTVMRVALWTVAVAYFPFFWVRNAQTPGMMPFGHRLVRADDLGAVGVGRALVRTFALAVSILSVVGVLWILVQPTRRGLHDLIAGTQVTSA
jgi:uncharacterized RDD family membrane protein YckC